jgi:hypothetical protein
MGPMLRILLSNQGEGGSPEVVGMERVRVSKDPGENTNERFSITEWLVFSEQEAGSPEKDHLATVS